MYADKQWNECQCHRSALQLRLLYMMRVSHKSVRTSAFAPLYMCLYTPALSMPLRIANILRLMHIPSSPVPMAVYVLTCSPVVSLCVCQVNIWFHH